MQQGASTVESSRPTILSRIIRLRLSYDGTTIAAPATVILKTGLPERASVKFDSGHTEVVFYREVAAVGPPGLVPRCFDAAWNAETKAWHLLLEDLIDTHFVAEGWPFPPSLAQSRQIIATLARFHAAWWDDARLGASIGRWLDPSDPQLESFVTAYAYFADRLGEHLSPARREVYERLIDQGHRLNARYHTYRDMTLVHGDAHAWNAFLPKDGDDDVRLFDWDSWRIDVATDDLAYMIALQWFPDHRRRWQRQLLDHYHAALVGRGISGYDRRVLDDDYRLSVLWQIATPVWQAANDLPRWIWAFNLERIFLAVDDLDRRDLLD
jgi:thiamine kinase-like enzyme